jgi:tumor protein p53-inducible protein 3
LKSTDGEWILYGLMGGGSVNGDILAKIMRKRIHLKSSTLRARSSDYKKRLLIDFEQKLMNHFISGNLKPIIDQVFSLEDIAKAHQRMESNLNMGKILLQVIAEDDQANKVKTEL